jgi:hypothetical protein
MFDELSLKWRCYELRQQQIVGCWPATTKKRQRNTLTFKGSINVDGVEYWLSAWVREGKEGGKMAGRKFFSLSVSPKEQAAPKAAPQKGCSRFEQLDDDIPAW